MSHTELLTRGPDVQSGKLEAARMVLLRTARPLRRRIDFAMAMQSRCVQED